MSYIYYKNPEPKKKKLNPRTKKYIASSLFAVGLFLIASVIVPIIEFQLEYSIKFGQMINPLSTKFYNQSGNILGEITTDYTQLNNWFVADTSIKDDSTFSSINQTSYTISIPALKIKNAVVSIGGQDLKKSLVQYPQTALPGQLGNGVVFGHSVLSQFFNPKSYLTIFSTLYRLQQGDEIYINYDNIQYKYLVEEMFEVQPSNLSILEQRFDGKFLSLVTCSPPGTTLRRLVVRARIADN